MFHRLYRIGEKKICFPGNIYHRIIEWLEHIIYFSCNRYSYSGKLPPKWSVSRFFLDVTNWFMKTFHDTA